MSEPTYSFLGEIVHKDLGPYNYTVVYLPAQVRRQLPADSRAPLRVRGRVGGAPFDGAWQPAKGGRWYILLSKRYLKQHRLKVGEQVEVCFQVADQDAVDVPSELRHALDADQRMLKAWNSLTPGKQRGLAYRVASAKRPQTRETRVELVLEELAGYRS